MKKVMIFLTALFILLLAGCQNTPMQPDQAADALPTAAETPVSTPALTSTPEMTATPKPTATPTATPTPTAAPTASPKPAATQKPESTPKTSATPKPTATPKPASTPAPVSTPAPTKAPDPTPTPAPAEPEWKWEGSSYGKKVCQGVNEVREQNGTAALTYDSGISASLKSKLTDMVNNGTLANHASNESTSKSNDGGKTMGVSSAIHQGNLATGSYTRLGCASVMIDGKRYTIVRVE